VFLRYAPRLACCAAFPGYMAQKTPSWEGRAKRRYLKAELKRADIGYRELARAEKGTGPGWAYSQSNASHSCRIGAKIVKLENI
jgi:hypothetical protein